MSRKLCCIFLAAALLVPGFSGADSLALPQGVTVVEESAFEDCITITVAELPEGVTEIGKAAFKGCTALGSISLPASLQSIGEDAFTDCPADMLVAATAGSDAARWAMNNSRDFNAGTKYRALLIGNTYSGEDELFGSPNDVAAMERCLKSFPGTPFEVTIEPNLDAYGILEAIGSTFGKATENDVSLFYYSGHGYGSVDPAEMDPEYQGALVGNDLISIVTASRLRQELDTIPGRKILIIDSCFSGAHIRNTKGSRSAKAAAGQATGGTAEDYVNSFISAFSARKRGSGTYSSYFIMTAASEAEYSYETGYFTFSRMGVFTRNLVTGVGSGSSPGEADGNENSVITIQEAFQYAANKVAASSNPQHAKVYPAGCSWFGWLRK